MRTLFALTIFSISILTACGPSGSGDDAGDDAGACMPEGATMCVGNTFETCTAGTFTVSDQCSALCDDDLGCIACVPDQAYCNGDTVMQCATDGSGGTVTETCSGGDHCMGGQCVNLCQDAADTKSYIGCEYYAVDLDNAIEILDNILPGFFQCTDLYPGSVPRTDIKVCWDDSAGDSAGLCDEGDTCPSPYTCMLPTSEVCTLDAQHSPFAVVVSNPQSFPVHVTISSMATGAEVDQMVTVAAGAVQSIFPQQLGFADQSLDRTQQVRNAYKLVADAPIVAYQFNPLDNVGVFSNDASLLIPTTTWDADYHVLSYPTLTRRPDGTNDYNGYLTVIAGSDATTIEVTPSAGVRANGSISAIASGVTTQFTLNAYEVLNLEAVGGATSGHTGGDLTGSRVHSLDVAKPVGVFGGHEAIVVPQATTPNAAYPTGPCCADHAEEMMFPDSTWGKVFAVARSKQRNGEPDNIRVLAQHDGTVVTFTPAPASIVSGTCASLAAGQFCEVKINVDTEISSTEPVLVGHYLEAVIWQDAGGNSIGTGDPDMSVAVPTEQFRHDYTILVPSQYAENYVSIATTSSGSVSVDGNDVGGQLAAFANSYRGGRIAVVAGQHKIHCSDGCGIEVMGYDDAVSYMFPGGLDLNIIVVN